LEPVVLFIDEKAVTRSLWRIYCCCIKYLFSSFLKKRILKLVLFEGVVMCVGCPIAIRIEEKGEGFENGNFFGVVV
jgi:hypothetical protein